MRYLGCFCWWGRKKKRCGCIDLSLAATGNMPESWRKFIKTRVSVVNSPFVEQLYHIPCCSGTQVIETVNPDTLPLSPDVSSLYIFRSISLYVCGLLDKLADCMYCRVMGIIVLIILREPVGYRSQQQWGICRSTWSSFCAVRAFRVGIKHSGFVQSACYQTTLMHDYAKRKYGFVNFLHFTGYLHMLAFRSPVLPSFVLP